MEHRVIYTRPYDSEIEYLEHTSNSHSSIVIPIKPSTNYVYKWRYKILNLTDYSYVFNTEGNTGDLFIFGGTELNNSTQLHIKSDANTHGIVLQNNVLYDGVLRKNGSNIEEYLNDVIYVSLPYEDFTAPSYLRFLANSRITVRLYYLQIINNGNLIADLIPVRKGTKGYMYDRVSGKLLTNNGTDNFGLGDDIPNTAPSIRNVLYVNNQRCVIK